MKTISELNTKVWYRAVKVLYILLVVAVFLIGIFDIRQLAIEGFFIYLAMFLLILVIVTEFLRRILYYIVLGSLKPTNVEVSKDKKKIHKADSKMVLVFAYTAFIFGSLSMFNFIYEGMWQNMNSLAILGYMLTTLILLIWGIYIILRNKGRWFLLSVGVWISIIILSLLIYSEIALNSPSVDQGTSNYLRNYQFLD